MASIPTPPASIPSPPDLHSQLEELFDAVWEGEANWRLDDRIDLALNIRPRTPPEAR